MFDLPRMIAKAHRMDDATWERHASPWSVWTRVPTLVPLLGSIWSHTTLGHWALIPFAGVVLWAWLNPRLFPPPATTDTWASKAVFGERVWLNRAVVPIPRHHAQVAMILTTISAVGFVPALVGAWLNDLTLTVGGGATAFFAKLWFCDRMVWLYEDMKDEDPVYRSWLRLANNGANFSRRL